MKTIKHWWAIPFALLAFSCAINEEEIVTGDGFKYPSEVYARIDAEDKTRVYADENLKVLWDADDRISLFNKYTFNKEYRFTGKTGANSGSFKEVSSGEVIVGNKLDKVYAVYPYHEETEISNDGVITLDLPAEQTYKENSFGRGANTMVSATENTELLFKNLCGYLILKLYGEGVSVATITLKGNKSEPLAGTAQVTASDGSVPSMSFGSSGTSNEITLVCESPVELGATAEEATVFWLAVPPTTFSDGFTITVTDPYRGTFEKSASFSCEIKRNKTFRMSALEVKVEANNVIKYSTYDEQAVRTNPDAFDAIIVSNEYVSGEGGTIVFDGPVTVIGENAFPGTVTRSETDGGNLNHIVFPSTVKTIAKDAIKDHDQLTSVTIQGELESIEQGAFSGCTNLVSIIFESESSTPPEGLPEVLEELENCTVFVPEEAIANFSGTGLGDRLQPAPEESSLHYIYYTSTDGMVVTPFTGTPWAVADDFDFGEGVHVYDNEYSGGRGTLTLDGPPTRIGPVAFQNCDNLESITIPENVTTIGNYAFANCSALSTITIPAGVTSIGKYAFEGSSALTSITVETTTPPAGGEYMFNDTNDCPIFVPSGSVGTYKAAEYWSDYEDRIFAEGTCVIIYTSSDGEIVVPSDPSVLDATIKRNEYYDGYGIMEFDGELTTIGPVDSYECEKFVFEGCNTLTSIIIPEGVTSIGWGAFDNCSSLESVTLPESLNSIGGFAFNECINLESLSIRSLKSIGQGAFMNCTGLTSVVISEAVDEATIGGFAFSGCSSLTSITIPEGVRINGSAFKNCSSLSSFTIPDSVTFGGGNPFIGCSSLKEFKGRFASSDGRCLVKDEAVISFAPYGVYEYVIPDLVTKIDHSAFMGCPFLKAIRIPDGVTEIGASAFSDCAALESIRIPDGVTSIGGGAFKGCAALESVNIPTGIVTIDVATFDGCSSLSTLVIPEGVASIRSAALRGCSSLTSITLPESLTIIEQNTFTGCSGLEEFKGKFASSDGRFLVDDDGLIIAVAPSGLTEVTIPEGVKTLGNQLFRDNTNITSLILPESLTTIGSYAFYNCTGLETVTIPGIVSSMGSGIFMNCTGLTSVTIMDGVTSISDNAFSGCRKLNHVSIPSTVKKIGNYAFQNCPSFESITIPASVAEIGESAFANNSNAIVTILAIIPPTGSSGMFSSTPTIYVPAESVDLYKEAEYWSVYADRIQAIPE